MTRPWPTIGDPIDANGRRAVCAYCDRAAVLRTRIDGEIQPACMRHLFPRERENEAKAMRRTMR